ncbi:hypothetical protein [Pseudomonas laurylsulfativorans]|uniref:hypothetical protein n=1 Tax=Pseudomonas laurylsulfativorans TaxID=1943631 RepID=UPI001056E5BB|nr:hypothetical protein [Pseudomonas laurylsulfativorans]
MLSDIPVVHHAHSLIEQTQAHQGKPGSGQLIPISNIGGQRLEFSDGNSGHEMDFPYFYPHKNVGARWTFLNSRRAEQRWSSSKCSLEKLAAANQLATNALHLLPAQGERVVVL